jgi:hypothetical protein
MTADFGPELVINLPPSRACAGSVFMLDAVCTVLTAPFREDELRNEASVGQTALKVVQAQGEVVAFYHREPSSLSKPGCGEIDLLDYGQAACFKSGAHCRGARKETRRLAHGKGKTGAPPSPWAVSLQEKQPPGFSTRAISPS